MNKDDHPREAARRARLEALRAHDMDAYVALVQQERSEVLHRVLARTDECLQRLARRLPGPLAARLLASDSAQQHEAWRMLAASLQADIAEQPVMLQGGQLHGFQMQGLRWMVGLIDAQLNGILAVCTMRCHTLHDTSYDTTRMRWVWARRCRCWHCCAT